MLSVFCFIAFLRYVFALKIPFPLKLLLSTLSKPSDDILVSTVRFFEARLVDRRLFFETRP